ncbi:MAG: hypothetical protein ACFCUT_08470 [Kiloniellaceae bacterium]
MERQIVASAGLGFAAGVALAAALLACDCFGLGSLTASGDMPLATMALFALGLGVILSPVGLATAFGLSGSGTPERGTPSPDETPGQGGIRTAQIPGTDRYRRQSDRDRQTLR